MIINLLCFTKENEVIALTNEDQLFTTLGHLLLTHTNNFLEEFETIEQMIDCLNEHSINSTKLKLDLSDLIEEEN